MPKKNSIFVDTSGWAELADRRQPLHVQMRAIYQQAVSQQRTIVTTNYIFAELVPLLDNRLHFPRPDIFQFVEAIKSATFVETIYISNETDQQAWDLLKARVDKGWSLVDATSFVLMQQYGMTEALTTDHHFLQAGFVRLPHQN